MSEPRTLVVIPAFNEADVIGPVLTELEREAPTFDILVVDDGSTDGTAEIARKSGAAVVTLPFNLGIGGALRTGFVYAVRHDYDRALQFDADGQHDPTQIGLLLEALDGGADMAIGSRFADEAHSYDVGRVRARAMGVLRFMVRQLSGQSFTDTSTGFRAFTRPVLDFFATNYPYEYMESVEALVLACAQGFRVDEVPVRMRNRELGSPSNRRFRLIYHYVRLLLVITATAGRRPIQEVSS